MLLDISIYFYDNFVQIACHELKIFAPSPIVIGEPGSTNPDATKQSPNAPL